MNTKEVRKAIANSIYPDIFINFDEVSKELNDMFGDYEKKSNEAASLRQELDAVYAKQDEYESALVPEIDFYLSSTYDEVENPRYIEKRSFKDKDIAVEVNQFISPNQFEVKKVLAKVKPNGSTYQKVNAVSTWVSANTKWTDDKNLSTSGDYYLYPEESIVYKNIDCEDCGFLMASLLPENIGVAYGFMTVNKNRFGHAFPVFVHEDELWVAEVTGDKPIIKKFVGSEYEIYFIVTQKHTYRVKSGVSFGKLAGF